MTVLTLGHALDPTQAIPYKRLEGLVRMSQRRPDLRPVMSTTWEQLQVLPAGRTWGPITLATRELSKLGWHRKADSPLGQWTVTCKASSGTWVDTDLARVDPAQWGHIVREALREQKWREAAWRRPDMKGLETGVDKEVTNLA